MKRLDFKSSSTYQVIPSFVTSSFCTSVAVCLPFDICKTRRSLLSRRLLPPSADRNWSHDRRSAQAAFPDPLTAQQASRVRISRNSSDLLSFPLVHPTPSSPSTLIPQSILPSCLLHEEPSPAPSRPEPSRLLPET